MNKLEEILEELKNRLIDLIRYNKDTERQLLVIANKHIKDLLEMLDWYGVNFPSIKEYMESEINALEDKIRNLCEDRKYDIIKQVSGIIREAQEQIESETESQENEEDNGFDPISKKIENIDTEEDNILRCSLIIIEDFIKSVKSRTLSIMDAHGEEQRKIDHVNDEFNSLNYRALSRDEQEIGGYLSEERKRIIEMLIAEYQDAREAIKREIETSKDERQEFKDELDAGISLEEQAKAAQKREEIRQLGITTDNSRAITDEKGKSLEEINKIISQLGITEDTDEPKSKPEQLGQDIELM